MSRRFKVTPRGHNKITGAGRGWRLEGVLFYSRVTHCRGSPDWSHRERSRKRVSS